MTMGNSIEQHRAAIGLFNVGRSSSQHPHRNLTRHFCDFWLIFLLLAIAGIEEDPLVTYLLTSCMDVERNPGPVNDEDYLTICNMNIRSINAKANTPGGITRFEAFKNAVENTYDIVTLTETWLKHEHPTESYALPGFIGPYRVDRPDNTGHGGVAAWVRSSLVSKRRDDLEELNHETLWLQVANKQKQLLICVTYRQKLGNYAPTYWAKLEGKRSLEICGYSRKLILTIIGINSAIPTGIFALKAII